MSSPFLAEVRIFAGSYAPKSWASCDGQSIPISQNTALFSLIGNVYGGNGTSNFALPNFAADVPVGGGQGPGLSQRVLGQTGGATSVTLTTQTMANHTHPMSCRPLAGTQGAGPNNSIGSVGGEAVAYQSNTTASLTPLNPGTLTPIGGGGAHNNVQPFLALFFAICLYGTYPQWS